jgi:hypothetical protein
MLVLVLAASSFLMFLAVLACLFVADTLESREITHKQNVWTERPRSLLCIPQAFEPIYAPLWEAPLAALRVAASTKAGVPATRLYPMFREGARHFPEVYDGCEFAQWLTFLVCEDLISWHLDTNQVSITETGKKFLENRFVSSALLEA